MKAISLIQPWASLVILGAKRYETRSWQTAHRGPLLIHSSKKLPKAAFDLCFQEPFKTALAPLLMPYEPTQHYDPTYRACPWDLALGFVLGIVELVNCHKVEDVSADITTSAEERAFGDYRPGRWAWELEVVQRFETPIPLAGHLGLWEVSSDLLPPMGAYGVHRPTNRTH